MGHIATDPWCVPEHYEGGAAQDTLCEGLPALEDACDEAAEKERIRCFLASLPPPWEEVYHALLAEWDAEYRSEVGVVPDTARVRANVASRMRKNGKHVLMGLMLPGYLNYLSFILAGTDPPYGLALTPNPTRVSKRDFSQRLLQFKQSVRRYDLLSHPGTVERLRADPKAVLEAFKQERQKALASRSRKRHCRGRLKKRQKAAAQAADPDHWRREVIRRTADQDPDLWRAEAQKIQRREEEDIENEQKGHEATFWREELIRLGVHGEATGSESASEDDDDDDDDDLGCGKIASDVVSSILETKDEKARRKLRAGRYFAALQTPPPPFHADIPHAPHAPSTAPRKKRKRSDSLGSHTRYEDEERSLDALRQLAALSISGQ